jgi:hypothetical protein
MARHYYEGRATGTNLWIPDAQMGKKQIRREAAFLSKRKAIHEEQEHCNFKPDGKVVWLRRVKKSGDPYMLKVIIGDKCGSPAAIVRRDPDTGAAVRRCSKHVSEPLQEA